MKGWEIIVLDLNTNKPKAYIPTPNGGDTHSGGFVRYNADWTGELLADMGCPKGAVRKIMRERVAARAQDPFTRLVACAMTGFLTIPAAVNAAVVMGLLPTTGFTLPFVSYGSNSLVMCALAVGILLRIAGHGAVAPARGRGGLR